MRMESPQCTPEWLKDHTDRVRPTAVRHNSSHGPVDLRFFAEDTDILRGSYPFTDTVDK